MAEVTSSHREIGWLANPGYYDQEQQLGWALADNAGSNVELSVERDDEGTPLSVTLTNADEGKIIFSLAYEPVDESLPREQYWLADERRELVRTLIGAADTPVVITVDRDDDSEIGQVGLSTPDIFGKRLFLLDRETAPALAA